MSDSRSYIVFGASGGIGSAIARRLRAQGERVVLAGRSEEKLRQLGDEIDCAYEIADATVVDEVEALCVKIAEETEVAGVVNCVGSLLLKPAHLTSNDEWQATLACNLTSAFAVVRGGYRAMRGTGGSIVLFASAAARTGLPNHDAIAAAKAGVIGLMQSSAASYAARNIRVNAIAPGLVKTPMTESIWGKPKAAGASAALHALGRLGEPDEPAATACWLLSPDSSWVTGQTIGVDGGLATLRPR